MDGEIAPSLICCSGYTWSQTADPQFYIVLCFICFVSHPRHPFLLPLLFLSLGHREEGQLCTSSRSLLLCARKIHLRAEVKLLPRSRGRKDGVIYLALAKSQWHEFPRQVRGLDGENASARHSPALTPRALIL